MIGKTIGWYALLLVFFHNNVFAQATDTTVDTLNNSQHSSEFKVKELILPVSLISVGSLVNHSNFEHTVKTKIQDKAGTPGSFEIEDYLQYAPIGELYLADAFRVPARNDWFHQTLNLCLADFASTLITSSLKVAFQKTRPNGGTLSFPSGHTTFSFTNATVLYYEFRETSPVWAYSGFGFSTATGALRMVHNKHWLSDVLAGAGIGMGVATLVYAIDPFQNWQPFHKKHKVALVPSVQAHSAGIYFAMEF